MEYMEIKRKIYSNVRIRNVAEKMDNLGFKQCELNGDGNFVFRKLLDYKYFSVTVSYIFEENHLAVWIDEDKDYLFMNNLPGYVHDSYDLFNFVTEVVNAKI